jgi:hypothetical protein
VSASHLEFVREIERSTLTDNQVQQLADLCLESEAFCGHFELEEEKMSTLSGGKYVKKERLTMCDENEDVDETKNAERCAFLLHPLMPLLFPILPSPTPQDISQSSYSPSLPCFVIWIEMTRHTRTYLCVRWLPTVGTVETVETVCARRTPEVG